MELIIRREARRLPPTISFFCLLSHSLLCNSICNSYCMVVLLLYYNCSTIIIIKSDSHDNLHRR